MKEIRRFFALDLIILYLVTASILFIPLLSGDAHILYLFGLCGIYFILLSGFNLCAAVAGQISFGHGGLYALGAYTCVLLVMKGGWPWIPSALAGIFASLIGGIILALTAYGLKAFYLGMSTTAFGWILYKIIWAWISFTGGEPGLPVKPAAIGGFQLLELELIYIIAGLALFSLVISRNILNSRMGRALRAISANEVVAFAAGVNVTKYKFIIFVISAFFAGLAGVLYAYFTMFVDPSLSSLETSFSFIIILIIGGWASIFGPIAGSILYVIVPSYFLFLKEHWVMIWGVILICILLLSPKGLVGIFSNILSKLKLSIKFSFSRRPKENLQEKEIRLRVWEGPRYLANNEPITLSVKGVSKNFGGLKAVNNVDLTIRHGRIHSLIGPNGSGKTTLVNLITGFYPIDKGEIILDGKRIDNLHRHQIVDLGLSRTFQGANICEGMNVLDNVMIGRHCRMRSGWFSCAFATSFARREERESKDLALSLLKYVGLADKAFQDAENLGDGERRLLEIVRAVATNPRILILDEPVSSLSNEEIMAVMEKLRELSKQGLAIFLIEHHIEAVMAVSEIISVLNFGNKIAEGGPQEIKNNEDVLTAYLGRKGKFN